MQQDLLHGDAMHTLFQPTAEKGEGGGTPPATPLKAKLICQTHANDPLQIRQPACGIRCTPPDVIVTRGYCENLTPIVFIVLLREEPFAEGGQDIYEAAMHEE